MNFIEKIYLRTESSSFEEKALHWSDQFRYVSYLNPNNVSFPFGAFEHVLAVGNRDIPLNKRDIFSSLKKEQNKGLWQFGYLSYDLKNQIEQLDSKNNDLIGLAEAGFFNPKHLIFFENESIRIISSDPDKVMDSIIDFQEKSKPLDKIVNIEPSMSKKEYLQKAKKIKKHIENGDVYELNLCMEFQSQNTVLNPIQFYRKLCKVSPMPFSGFQKWNSTYLMCASPERFIKKTGDDIISQPIKGTIRRGIDEQEDLRLKETLQNDEKEIAENMMIVDLVRNDLAKTAKTGTILVNELFEVYSFEQVHQMISTVSSKKRDDVDAIDIIYHAFPMGSMTGAPKIKSMELIERYENTKRGLYSGSIGYFNPTGDFDFNVVIRSLIYNQSEKTISYQVGSAITYDSIPEKEYDECLLKAQAIIQVLNEN